VNEHERFQTEKHALQNITRAYLCLKDPYDQDRLGLARALCLDAVDLLEMALGIDDESQVLRLWDKRFEKPPSG
jgi:hypothetical protein